MLGNRIEDDIRPAVAYWHPFVWEGGDPFGGRTFYRPWFGDTLAAARVKADVAFELFERLDEPFFCFYDRDIAPESTSLAESNRNFRAIAKVFQQKMERSRTLLLWGTANLFSHRRYIGWRRQRHDLLAQLGPGLGREVDSLSLSRRCD